MKKHLTLFVCLLLFMICGGAGFAQSKTVTMEFGGKKMKFSFPTLPLQNIFFRFYRLKTKQ